MHLEEIVKFDHRCRVAVNGHFNSLGIVMWGFEKDTLTFCNSLPFLKTCIENNDNLSALIVKKDDYNAYQNKYGSVEHTGIVISEQPQQLFFRFHNHLVLNTDFYKRASFFVIGKNTQIAPSAIISKNNVSIGKNVIIEDRVIIRDNVEIGDNTIIRAGSIIGCEGFQFNKSEQGNFFVAHAGGVKLGSNVEVQYNCTIDKHIFNGNTEISDNTKLDNFVYFAHGSKVGKNSLIAAGAIISGSTSIGDNVWIGPGAVISTGLLIDSNSKISLGSVVTKNVKENERVSGNFAIRHDAFIDFMKAIRK